MIDGKNEKVYTCVNKCVCTWECEFNVMNKQTYEQTFLISS